MRAAERARSEAKLSASDWRELAEGAVVILRALRKYAPWWGRLAVGWVLEELEEWIAAHPPERGVPEHLQP